MLIAALRAAGAPRLHLHPRRVRPAATGASPRAVEEAYAAGLLGPSGWPAVRSPATSSSTAARAPTSAARRRALLTSLEGKKGYPRNRPPRLTVRGLYQRPTVVNNVETLANITGIVRDGAEAFRKVGTAKSPGTQLISISGHVSGPGVYEVEYGYPFAKFIHDDCGGVLGGGEAEVRHPGRHLDQGADRRRDRAADARPRQASRRRIRRSARAA